MHHQFKPGKNSSVWYKPEAWGTLWYSPECQTVLCLSFVFATQLDPTSQIVICFLFAQPLECKLLSVNQATNYTAAAAEWHLVLRARSDIKKKNMKRSVGAEAALFFFNYEISCFPAGWQANRKQKREAPSHNRTIQNPRSKEMPSISVELEQTLGCSWVHRMMAKACMLPAWYILVTNGIITILISFVTRLTAGF